MRLTFDRLVILLLYICNQVCKLGGSAIYTRSAKKTSVGVAALVILIAPRRTAENCECTVMTNAFLYVCPRRANEQTTPPPPFFF